ncbi:hypothetical protein ACG7TL_006941 [Trametes sanguinea]
MTESYRLEAARQRLIEAFQSTKASSPDVHAVTFQPLEPDCNADRMVTERWNIPGQRWLFLAVCDGHGGTCTSQYTIETLPGRLRTALERVVRKRFGGRIDRSNLDVAAAYVTSMFEVEIVKFDHTLKRAVRELCPDPREISKEKAEQLLWDHEDVFLRAFQGTTLVLALVNLDYHFMWAAGVGDSSVALSTTNADGKRSVELLCKHHTFSDPQEYYNTIMAHHSSEKDVVDYDNRLLGMLRMSRAIGDLPFKMDRAYTRHLFQYLPNYHPQSLTRLVERVVSPPYINAKPSVRFVDLEVVWQQDPVVLLFTDGVDNIVDGSQVFTPGVASGVSPHDVVSALLPGASFDSSVSRILGHPVEQRWGGDVENMAVDILGNLLGGTNAERLEMVLDRQRLQAPTPIFNIDDVTIMVACVATQIA